MKKLKQYYIFAQIYIQYLISTPSNYTCTNLANHSENISHDAINDYLKDEKHTARNLWKLAEPLINNTEEACLIVDDSVADKNYSKKIEMVKRQYSGNTHSLINGIGIVNLVHAHQDDFNPLDFRIYNPKSDGKTKNDHFRDMIKLANERGIKAETILFDTWYAGSENLKYIHKLGKKFITRLKENRLVSVNKEQGYIHLSDINWTEEQLKYGINIKLKQIPFKVQLFKIVATDGNIEWIITNHAPGSVDAQVIQEKNKMRWFIEQLHRELKQLTGIERCQCRKERAQRNHIFFCYQAWFSLKKAANRFKMTVYQVKQNLWSDYLRNELLNPRIPVYEVN